MPGGGVPMSIISLCVDIDQMATQKQAQGENKSDLIEGVAVCERSGCQGITVHLREDRRYIRDKDVFAIKDAVRGKFNLEIGFSDEIIDIAKKVNPHQVTIVPEKKEDMTSGGGLDVKKNMLKIQDLVKVFHNQNIRVSLLVEPDIETIELAKECSADFIEIHTGVYCKAADKIERGNEISRIHAAANHAAKLGIKVSAGRGLDYNNIIPVLNTRGLEEVHIGHSIISRSASVGLSQAIGEMLDMLD
jgi:pyridoxine 5-phosphate synthase